MAKLFKIQYDATAEEIEAAYKVFQNKYALKKKIIYTFVYLIVLVLGVDLIIKNPTSIAGFIATGLSAGILIFNWIKPYMIRKTLIKNLSELGTSETYIMSFYDEKVEVETIIDSSAETETVAITHNGIYTVEEGSEAEKEMLENPSKEEEIQKTVYNHIDTEMFFTEKDGLFMLFVNRAYIHTIPVRCLSESEQQQVRAYFNEKGLD